MTKEQVAQLLAFIGAVYPGIATNPQQRVSVWYLLLQDLEYPLAKQAVIYWLNSEHFEPKPADVRQLVWKFTQDYPADTEQAWSEVLKNLNPYVKPVWSNDLIKQSVQTIGYLNLCQSEHIGIQAAQFKKVYQQLLSSHKEEKLRQLTKLLVQTG